MAEYLDLNVFQDYYTLQAIIGHPRGGEFPDLVDQARSLLARIARPIADALFDYMFLITAGEARHASSMSLFWYWGDIPKSERTEAYELITGYDPVKVLPQLADLFGQTGWGSSYGGKKWQKIAQTALKYRQGEITPNLFIDHVADLKHNGGSQFSKSEVSNVIKFRLYWSGEWKSFTDFLNWKRDTKDFIDDVQTGHCVSSLSLPVGRLLAAVMARLGLIFPSGMKARKPIQYTPYPFGDKELTDKVDTGKKSPTFKPSTTPTSKPTSDSEYLSEDEMYDPDEDNSNPKVKETHDSKPSQPVDQPVKPEPDTKPTSDDFANWLSSATQVS